MIRGNLVFSFPDITELAAGKRPQAYGLKLSPLPNLPPLSFRTFTELASRKSLVNASKCFRAVVELKHFSVNKRFLATFCAVLIFASFYQEKEETIFAFSFSLQDSKAPATASNPLC